MKDQCPQCGNNPAKILEVAGRQFTFPCPTCADILERENTAAEEEARKLERREHYERVIPPRYRRSDVSMFPPIWKELEQWRPTDPDWILLAGETGACKSRMAARILSREIINRGIFGHFVTDIELAQTVRNQFNDPKLSELLRTWRKSPLLVLDDFGKANTTETIQEELFGLINHRGSHLRPTIITMNASAGRLKEMFSADRSDALTRRLKEFSKVYTVLPKAVTE